ncbi:MAG: phytoene desaturase [Prochlorothrix sp.]|nr:phytoene desaturase [Prochlorothrix sp.]
MKIIVIGSGFGGLSAAIRLQAQGHSVTLLDKRDKPGGRAYVYQQDGFTFDGGPTIITTPQKIVDLFAAADRSLAGYLTLTPLDPFYNIRFEDGSIFHYNNNPAQLRAQVQAFNPADVQGYEQFAHRTEEIFNVGLPLMETSFDSLGALVAAAPDMVRLQTYRSLAGFVSQYFQDPRLRQVFSFHPLLIGGHPFRSSALYGMIHKLEQAFGIWYVQGGTGALVQALVKLFQELGGILHLNREVTQIDVNPNTRKATGVQLRSGDCLEAETIISNGDVAHTYLQLVPKAFRRINTDRRLQNFRYSMSLFVYYFGTDRQYPDLAHHEILLGSRYRPWLDDLFNRKILPPDFSLYLHRPTATDPSLAPPGCDCWYVLAPVPNLDGPTDWQEMAQSYRDRLVQHLEQHYLPNLSQHIVTEHWIDPLHFRDTLNSHKGSAFSIEPTLFQSAWFRPHNHSEDIPNLYCVGAGTHPGAGLPGTLSSGKIVADLIGRA